MAKIVLNTPLMLGLNYVESVIDNLSKCNNYPPYNIEQIKDDEIFIKIAVAGFLEEELIISQEGNQLSISGSKIKDCNTNDDCVYIHRGISFRKFEKIFMLANGVEPVRSYLDHGILVVQLHKKHITKDIKIISIEKNS